MRSCEGLRYFFLLSDFDITLSRYPLAVASDMSLDVFDYETKDTDNTMIIFGLWVNLLVCLYLRGWTKENLIEELDTYQKIAIEMQDTA